jgi:hypothetical protein
MFIRGKYFQNLFVKNHMTRQAHSLCDGVGSQWGKVFSYVFIWKNIFKIFFSRTTGPKQLKITRNLSDIAQNQFCQNHGS